MEELRAAIGIDLGTDAIGDGCDKVFSFTSGLGDICCNCSRSSNDDFDGGGDAGGFAVLV